MFLNEVRSPTPQHNSQRQRHKNRVIQLAGYRDEVGHEVERQGKVGEQSHEQRLAVVGHALLAKQPPEKDQAVRNEAGQHAGLAAATEENQGENDDSVNGDKEPEGNQGCSPRMH
jgi:hypothetical protein